MGPTTAAAVMAGTTTGALNVDANCRVCTMIGAAELVSNESGRIGVDPNNDANGPSSGFPLISASSLALPMVAADAGSVANVIDITPNGKFELIPASTIEATFD